MVIPYSLISGCPALATCIRSIQTMRDCFPRYGLISSFREKSVIRRRSRADISVLTTIIESTRVIALSKSNSLWTNGFKQRSTLLDKETWLELNRNCANSPFVSFMFCSCHACARNHAAGTARNCGTQLRNAIARERTTRWNSERDSEQSLRYIRWNRINSNVQTY